MNMVFDRLFGSGQHHITMDGNFIAGTATVGERETVITKIVCKWSSCHCRA